MTASQPVHRRQLGSWLLKARRVEGLPLMSTKAWLRAGSLLEPAPAVSLITGRGLVEGTSRRSWRRIAREAEDRGMSVDSFGSVEAMGLSIEALAEDGDLALDWLAELLLEPSFPTARIEWIRRQAAAELDGMLDQPDYRASRAFMRQLYGEHPYGRQIHGSPAALAAVDAEACDEMHRQALSWGGCVTVTGDIDPDAALDRLATALEDALPATETPPVTPAIVRAEAPSRQQVTAGEADQAHLYLGHTTIERAHPDLAALELAAVVMGAGAGTTGRLPLRIREHEGLAYSTDVGTVNGAGLAAGRFVVYVGTAPEQVEQAERAAREEIERLVDGGIDDDELEEAQAYLVGREPFRRETLRQEASLMAEAAFYGLPSDRPGWRDELYRALDRPTVEAAIRRWIRPDQIHVTIGIPRADRSQKAD